MPIYVTEQVVIPEADLVWRFSRSSGPGGQGVNTTDSRAELSVDLRLTAALPENLRERVLSRLSGQLTDGVLTVAASEYRSQLQNRKAARERVAQILREALKPPPPPRRPTKPSRAAMRRRKENKRRRSQTKRLRRNDYP
ncbi:alternative ribosome rescue aminoacyl-tRNA hydrolase ArfB [Natronoglycomyces albus]|uniref:Aminoacyl-tRNA hydrolase n=1 Tax=Natronoglycomyces albus TaxID=2811108 RepID=A0A895XN28_9ACTN|nr:aminoacyl-tRNA hydrolase [Natronoglycomyces albus]